MKKKLSSLVLASALVLALAAGAALAMSSFGVIDLFSWKDAEGNAHANQAAADIAQTVYAEYTGKSVDFRMNDAIYDPAGGSYALSYAFTNKAPGEPLYVVCDRATFDGEQTQTRTESCYTEFLLPEGETQGGVIGELPENAKTGEYEMTYTVLRANGEIVYFQDTEDEDAYLAAQSAWRQNAIANGQIPMDGDGWIQVDIAQGQSYSDALIASGLFTLADRFTLNFTLTNENARTLVYDGPDRYTFEGYEIRIPCGEISPTAANITVEYRSDKPIGDGGKGFGAMWGVDFRVPGTEQWSGNSGGTISDPVRLEDGRWMSVYEFQALALSAQPDTLEMRLFTYDDDFTPTLQQSILLTFK